MQKIIKKYRYTNKIQAAKHTHTQVLSQQVQNRSSSKNEANIFITFHHHGCVYLICFSLMQECILQSDGNYMFENMSSEEITFCFRIHLRCFKVQHTPCVKSTRATSSLAGLQRLTSRKDVMKRSHLTWRLIFIWQTKSAHTVPATLSSQTLITISSHRIWVWDTTQRKGGKYGNTSGTWRTARSDSGSLDSTTRAS